MGCFKGRDEPMVLSLYLQQTTQRRHTPGLPVTYGNTQTQVTERQTEDNSIIHKRPLTNKDWPKKREHMSTYECGLPSLLCRQRLTI